MVVNLAAAQSPDGTELTYTDNVSTHGACVFSNHPWQGGGSRRNHSVVRSDGNAGKGRPLPAMRPRSVRHRLELPKWRGGLVHLPQICRPAAAGHSPATKNRL